MSEKVQPDGATSMSRLEYLERVAAINGSQVDTYRDLCDQLNAENAELRELVRDMWEWLAPTAVGGGAPLKGLHDRMRELGVEVK